jgi:hypothetical protein
MYKCHKVILTIVLMLSAGFCFAQSHAYPGVGRPATAKEVAAGILTCGLISKDCLQDLAR